MNAMRMLLVVLLTMLCLPQAWSAEQAVLLPITGPVTPGEQQALADEVAGALAGRYKLVQGEEVERYVRQVFQDESKKNDCDETNCYRRIAAHYKVDKIIALRVAQLAAGRYLLTFNVYDVPTGDMQQSASRECNACSFEKLRQLIGDLLKPETASQSVKGK